MPPPFCCLPMRPNWAHWALENYSKTTMSTLKTTIRSFAPLWQAIAKKWEKPSIYKHFRVYPLASYNRLFSAVLFLVRMRSAVRICPAAPKKQIPIRVSAFLHCAGRFECVVAHAIGHVHRPVQTLGDTSILFSRPPQGETECRRILPGSSARAKHPPSDGRGKRIPTPVTSVTGSE